MRRDVSAEQTGKEQAVTDRTAKDETGQALEEEGTEAQLQRAEVFRKALGRRIGVLRKERGHNQEDFARSVNLHRAHMGFVEQGRSNPNLLTLLRIAEGLGVSLSELVDVDLEGAEGAAQGPAAPDVSSSEE